MAVQQIHGLFFSPTGNTERVVRRLCAALAARLGVPAVFTDLTPAAARQQAPALSPEDLAVVGCPTYAGKLPNKLLPDLREALRCPGAPAVAVVTFGNRAFDCSLAELVDVLAQGGFRVAAAAALAARHAFTDRLAPGRPDEPALERLDAFAGQVADKLAGPFHAPVPVEGDSAGAYYVPKGLDGAPVNFLKAKPRTDAALCDHCGLCVQICPMGAIAPAGPAAVPGTCIKCHACVRRCPTGATSFDDPAFLSHVAMLERDFPAPKADRYFI